MQQVVGPNQKPLPKSALSAQGLLDVLAQSVVNPETQVWKTVPLHAEPAVKEMIKVYFLLVLHG